VENEYFLRRAAHRTISLCADIPRETLHSLFDSIIAAEFKKMIAQETTEKINKRSKTNFTITPVFRIMLKILPFTLKDPIFSPQSVKFYFSVS